MRAVPKAIRHTLLSIRDLLASAGPFAFLAIGLLVLAYLWRMAGQVKSVPNARQIRFLENGASYWHLVDLIWLVLFALFYLVG